MRRKVYINWTVSAFFGWGVYGLNLALNWADDPDLKPACPKQLDPRGLGVGPLRQFALRGFVASSLAVQKQLAAFAGRQARISGPVLTQLEGDFTPKVAAHGGPLVGEPSIGVTFFETARLPEIAVERARGYPVIVAGSTWNAEVLRAHGLGNVRLVLQGVDPTLFHPGPRSHLLKDRFLVFSGGKLERRKGQDLALAAFRRFAEKRPDALLVTAWHSPWTDFTHSLDESGLLSPVRFDAAGKLDVLAWARENGVSERNIVDLGAVPNPLMPQVLRDMDAAIFPNRAEGGTNLVAMECMACGVPTVISRNTGHLDLIEDGNCFPLDRQGPVDGVGAAFGDIPGWGESDVDEIVDALERIYLDRDEARRRGLAGAQTLSRLTWSETARQMKAVVLESLKAAP